MLFGILICVLVFGGASSYFQIGEYLMTIVIGSNVLPTLYEADIDTLAKGLQSKQITSVDLVKAGHRLSIIREIAP